MEISTIVIVLVGGFILTCFCLVIIRNRQLRGQEFEEEIIPDKVLQAETPMEAVVIEGKISIDSGVVVKSSEVTSDKGSDKI